MAIQSILIINKSGGLIYQREFLKSGNDMKSNDYLILAGTLHGVFAIASQLTPKALKLSSNGTSGNTKKLETDHTVPYITGLGVSQQEMGSFKKPDYFTDGFMSWNKSGLRQLVTDEFSMFVYQTLTGIKFVLISTQQSTSNMAVTIAENLLRKAYCLYSDYVMKNPFYSLEMPVKCELFDTKLSEMVNSL